MDWLFDPTTIRTSAALFLSFFSGFFIGATELITIFQYRRSLFKLKSFWGFLFLYGISGTVLFLLVSLQNPEYLQQPLIGLLVGLSFQTLIRSRFTFLRSQNEKGEKPLNIGLDLDQIFRRWETFIKKRIDQQLMPERRKLQEQLVQHFPTTARMKDEMMKRVYTQERLGEQERKIAIKQFENIFKEAVKSDDEIVLHRLADLIIEYSDFDSLQQDLETSLKDTPAPSPPMTVQAFLSKHPQLLDSLDQWKDKLTEQEWEFLQKEVQNPNLSFQEKQNLVASLLIKRNLIA